MNKDDVNISKFGGTTFVTLRAIHVPTGYVSTYTYDPILVSSEEAESNVMISLDKLVYPGPETSITKLQGTLHEWALRKEWRGPKSSDLPLVADLCLFTSEISEALEELRKNDDPLHYYETRTVMVEGVKIANLTNDQIHALADAMRDGTSLVVSEKRKPEGFGPEIADLVIRVLETCEEYNIDLAFEIDRKMKYNEGREVKHGGLLM